MMTVWNGVKEDIIDLQLNLKNLAFKLDEGVEEATAVIDVQGPCEVQGAHIALPHNVELVSPEVHIASITANTKLKMEITISRGIGFETAAERKIPGELKLVRYISIAIIRRSASQLQGG